MGAHHLGIAARFHALNLTTPRIQVAEHGSEERTHARRVIKVLGMVNCTPEFTALPQVINGCSELFAAVWGPDLGVGVRSAVGMASLPDDMAVEIEAVFELA